MPDAQNGFIIKQTVDRITICDKYMQMKFKCGVTFARQYVEKKNEQRPEMSYTAFRGADCDFYFGYFFRKWWK